MGGRVLLMVFAVYTICKFGLTHFVIYFNTIGFLNFAIDIHVVGTVIFFKRKNLTKHNFQGVHQTCMVNIFKSTPVVQILEKLQKLMDSLLLTFSLIYCTYY